MRLDCTTWSTSGVQWADGNWTWDDCQLVKEICAVWGETDVFWGNSNWRWSECNSGSVPPIPPVTTCAVWGETDVFWGDSNWRWSECNSGSVPPIPPVTASVFNPGIDSTTLIQPWLQPDEPWDAYKEMKRKRLIKLICKIKGKNFEEEKQAKEFNVSVNDIKMVVKAVANVDLTIRE